MGHRQQELKARYFVGYIFTNKSQIIKYKSEYLKPSNLLFVQKLRTKPILRDKKISKKFTR
jgi:hypothetical protein